MIPSKKIKSFSDSSIMFSSEFSYYFPLKLLFCIMIRNSKLLMLRSLQKLIYVLFFLVEIDFMSLNWLLIPHGKTMVSISKKFLSTLVIMPLCTIHQEHKFRVSGASNDCLESCCLQQTSSPSF
ncbi:unnamed protein product [Musa textilis]